jgi:hypothetical protein
MLRFAFEKMDEPPVRVDASHGYVLGANDLSVAGALSLRPGKLDCESELDSALAVNVECETRSMGRLALSTCLLQQRPERYSLLQELARHRIKLFIAKCEEWQVWDHPGCAAAIAQWNDARSDFTASMTTPDRVDADRRAAQSLVNGLEAGERLAVAHARIALHRRYETRAAGRVTIGARVTGRVSERGIAAAAGAFDLLQVPLDWSVIERQEGRFDFSSVEPWLEWASAQGKVVVVGPLLDLREQALPEWLRKRRGDFDALRSAAWRYAEAVGELVGSRTGMWNVGSGMNDSAWWPLKLEQMVEITRRIAVGLRKTRRDVPIMLEIPRPFAEGVGSLPRAVTPSMLVDTLGTEGVGIDCILAKFCMGQAGVDHRTRDLLEVSSALDGLRALRKTLFVSIDVPSGPTDPNAGYWRAPWSAKSQSIWARQMFQVAISKGHVATIVWNTLADDAVRGNTCGATTGDGMPKPVLEALVKARRRLAKPLGPWNAAPVQHTRSETAANAGEEQ